MPVYITDTSKFLPNKPVANNEMEEDLGFINGKPSKSKSIVLRNNAITNRYYALEKGGKSTHTNAQMTALAVKELFKNDPEKIKETLIKVFDNNEIAVTTKNKAKPSPPSPMSPEVFKPLERVTQQMWPGVPVVPTMSTGATDGLHLRNGGIPTYGVCGIFTDITDVRAHGKDERIPVKAFYEGQEFLYQVVKEYSSKTSLKRDY